MLHTSVCDVLGITHPIIQAGMARSYTSADLVAAVSAAGGLGVLGCLGRPADEALAEIRRIRALMGTRFLATHEAPAQTSHKRAILAAQPGDTLASDIFDILWGDEWPGVQTRAIHNQFTKRWAGREDELRVGIEAIRQQRADANADQDPNEMPLLAGAGLIRELKPAGQVVREVVEEAQQILREWGTHVS